MATLYTNGDYTALSPTQFNSYSLIRYSVDQPDQSVSLGLTVSGTVNFSTKLGTVSALVDGFTGSDNIVTGAGNDTIWGNSGSDVLSGGIGDDLLIGDWDTADRVGNDTLYGGDGDDELIGGPGSDAQYGGNGDDVFSIGEAAASVDSIFGGSGVDAVSIRDVFSVYVPTMSFSRLAFAEANSIEYLLWDNPGIAITGTTGSNLFDFSNLTVLCWNGSSYEDRFEVDLLAGNDTFLGGSGDEHVTTSGAGDRITLGDGDDRLTVLDGTLAGSTISAGAGHDTLDLGSLTGFDLPVKSLALSVLTSAVAMGFESIKIGQNVQLSGTAQADVFDFAPLDFNMMAYDLPILLLGGNDKVFGAAGDFRADGGTGNDTLTSEGGNDRLWGGDGNDVLSGGAGNDQLYGGLGADRLVGGEGGDIYQVDSLDDVIVETGLSGTDSVIFLRATYRLPTSIEDMFVGRASGGRAIGNAGGNQIFDGAGKDSLYGLGGNDTLTSNDNRDTLDGGRGDDVYDVRGNATAHIVERGGEGTDTVWTYLETYTLPDFVENLMGKHFDRGQVLTGNALGNYITGMSGRNHFFGLGGNDTLDGGAGADILEGGAGSDVYLVDNAQDKVIDSDSNGLVLSSADSYTLSSGVNRLELTGAARFGIGNTASNLMTASDIGGSLSGVGGNDDLRGGAAADNLYGGSGNDTLNGGAGNDYMVGGDDDDVYLADSVNDMLFEEAHGGIDTLIITAARVVLRDNIEILKNDYSGGTVNSAGSEVYGNAWGDDFATVGDNRITTGIGRDSLFGAGGNDTLTGGRGDDLFGAELNYFYRPFVTITDFQAGSDRIALHSGYFGPLETAAISALSEAEFKVLGKGQNLDADDRILYNPLTGVLWYDEDGSGSLAAIKFALLETHAVLTAADFVMIGMD